MKLPLLQVETERLMIRPFQKADYKSWLDGFNKRLPSQYKYDDGYHVMASSTKNGSRNGLEVLMKLHIEMRCMY